MKPYDVGLVCGRFQTFHKGHEKLIDTGLLLCDRMLILVGSAQECGTKRNPLNVNTRIKMIREVYGDDPNIMIYALSDLTDENDITPDWGRYLLQNVDRYIYKNPDVMIYGNDYGCSSKKEYYIDTINLISHLDYISKKDIGKKYFFTYEEAQTKLKELQNAHLI